jgi:DNA repair protein RecN (Recombination protein N)
LLSLNMPKAEFEIKVSPQKRSLSGDDLVEFYIAPNPGERLLSVKDGASGGELSRLLLSIQTLLAGKEQIPTLIFDEVDANIGGATAAEVGKKLKEIGAKHQILCITHFPQVAKQANHHYQISKQEIKGRTLTQIHCLDEQSKQHELSRMLGEPILMT